MLYNVIQTATLILWLKEDPRLYEKVSSPIFVGVDAPALNICPCLCFTECWNYRPVLLCPTASSTFKDWASL